MIVFGNRLMNKHTKKKRMLAKRMMILVFWLMVLSFCSAGWTQESNQTSLSKLQFRLASFKKVEGWTEFKNMTDGKPIFLDKKVIVSEREIVAATPLKQNQSNAISVRLTQQAGRKLGKVSAGHLGKPIAILFEGRVITAPLIQTRIERDVVISGNFTDSQVKRMLQVLQNKLATPKFAQADLDDLAKQLDRAHDKKKFSGTVLIAVDGKIVFEKSVGYANIEDKTRFTPESSFRLASVSKQFTAMGIMLLKEEGKLDYDDDITKFFPELPYEGVTLRHLLHHTGGLPDYMALFFEHWDRETDMDNRKTAFNADLVKLFAEHKPEPLFAPGDRFDYSNTGYVLLGNVIAKASGQKIQDFFKHRVFDPLEMKHSGVFDAPEFLLASRVYGFAYQGEGHIENDWNFLNGMVGDGGIYASARDLLKWDQALYGEKLVKKSTLEEAFTPGKVNDGTETGYGFGWLVERTKNEGLITAHDGSWVGFRTSITRHPERRLTIITLSNNSTLQMDQINRAIREMH